MAEQLRIGEVARRLGLSVSRVRQLADAGRLSPARTAGGHRVFDPGQVRILEESSRMAAAVDPALGTASFAREYTLAGLEEHFVWRELADTLALDAASPAVHIVEYAFLEMLNNAIEHSAGTTVGVRFWSRAGWLAFVVSDDGVGALARLREGLGLPDDLSAIQELSKGKRTTAPDAHTGQGVFFTSKAVDRFSLTANGWRWTVDNQLGDQTVATASAAPGTLVACVHTAASTRTMSDIFAEFTHGSVFDTTRPRVSLLGYGTRLISRSEARLLLEGLDRFAEVELDFGGVDSVGQGFVDEVFRVWASTHPGSRFVPVNMSPGVRFMVERGLPGASSAGQ